MKYVLGIWTMACFVISILIGISEGWAGTNGVIKIIPTGQYPGGLAWDGKNLWLGYTSSSQLRTIDKIDTADGTVLKSIPEPNPDPAAEIRGLAWDGNYLWVYRKRFGSSTPDRWDYIYKMDTTGTVLDSVRSPVEDYVGGLAFGEGSLWLSQYYPPNVIHKVNPATGAIEQTINAVGEQPMGVAYDGQFLWCAEDTGFGATRQEIYKYDPKTGTYTGEFLRNPDDAPQDMTWDGQYLWLVGYYSQQIYQIDVARGTPQINVPTNPVLFGKIAVGDTATYNLSVFNTGNAPLIINQVVLNSFFFRIQVPTLPDTIAENSSKVYPVSFIPATYGTISAEVEFFSNDPLMPQLSVTLMGKGLFAAPTINLIEAAHDFGNVWVPQEGLTSWNMGIHNMGSENLLFSGYQFAGSEFTLETPPLPVEISPDDTSYFRVWFSPPAAQTYRDTLRITSNDSAQTVAEVYLSGTGVAGPFGRGYPFWSYQTPLNRTGNLFMKVEGLKQIGDVNGDGTNDVVFSSENYWTICLNGASATNADTLWTFNTGLDNMNTGSISLNGLFSAQKALQIASDLNSDGVNDVVIGTDGGNEHVYALSGKDGSVIWAFGSDTDPSLGGFGAVDVRRDFTGDLIPDVVTAASSNSDGLGYKSVYLFDGSNGAILWQYPVPYFGTASAYSAISISDVTGDGIPDAVAGYGSDAVANFAVALNGATGTPIWSYQAGIPNGAKELLELPVPGETPDVIISDFWGSMFRLDGETGAQIWQFEIGNAPTELALIPDVNGNGFDDLLVANMTNLAYCLDGDTGQIIWFFQTTGITYGTALISDLDGDGLPEALFGDHTGMLFVHSGAGDSLIASLNLGTRVFSVASLASVDGNPSDEILAGLDDGKILCLSGGETVTAIPPSATTVPAEFRLAPNYPNPFNPVTTIAFSLPVKTTVQLEIFNALGERVSELIPSRPMGPGWHRIHFNADGMPSGIYYYRLKTPAFIETRKMVLLR